MIFGFLKSPTLSPRQRRLQNTSLFRSLKPLEIKFVDGLMHERRYLPDEIVFDEGEEGQALYLVMSGRVQISRGHGAHRQVVSELGRAVSSATWHCSTIRHAAPRCARSTRASWPCSSATISWR